MSRTVTLPIPGLALGAYPERKPDASESLAWLAASARGMVAQRSRIRRRDRHFVERVAALAERYARMSGAQWSDAVQEARARLVKQGFVEDALAGCFALFDAACARSFGYRPHATQMIAARVMLDNRLAEMATGEGKTLAAALAAASVALAGVPVHVVTANDYLAERDADALRPVYEALGLRAGVVLAALDADARRQAYRAHITYCTAKELAFDYLRDRLARGGTPSELTRRAQALNPGRPARPAPVLRGLCMAILDEADSILIDEARVPLILSQASGNAGELEFLSRALQLASTMAREVDFRLDAGARSVELTPKGCMKVLRYAIGQGPVWRNRRHSEDMVCRALEALHLLRREHDYLVKDGRVQIIDATTGRLAAGRAWSRGVHQLVELKEGCTPTRQQVTAAQITYQRFFPRYFRLCGMSGTLASARTELLAVYGLRVAGVPLREPSARVRLRTRMFATDEARCRAVVEQIKRMRACGRPVLVGTESVEASEALARHLIAAGVRHVVLNARQDENEAEIVAQGGELGRVTVATNMAGRGTDIALALGVAELGGLHVMLCQLNASPRLDRQFIGRCARRGEPGSYEVLLSMEAELIRRVVPGWLRAGLRAGDGVRFAWLARLCAALAQRLEDRRQRRQRRELSVHDERLERQLHFGGGLR